MGKQKIAGIGEVKSLEDIKTTSEKVMQEKCETRKDPNMEKKGGAARRNRVMDVAVVEAPVSIHAESLLALQRVCILLLRARLHFVSLRIYFSVLRQGLSRCFTYFL